MRKTLLAMLFCVVAMIGRAQIHYGENPAAGGYFNTGDAKIYYEVYGKGRPVVLLHGGVYGGIAENHFLIPVLSKKYMVIAVNTRGHGKSELGHQLLSYQLNAEDAYKILRHLTTDSAIVIGVADGAMQGYYFAANHPDGVRKLVALGSGFGAKYLTGDDEKYIKSFGAAYMEKNEPQRAKAAKKMSPEPNRYDEFIDNMGKMRREEVYINKQAIASIKCPTLIATGDKDGCPVEVYTEMYRALKNGQLAIIPGSDSLILEREPKLTLEIVLPFIEPKSDEKL